MPLIPDLSVRSLASTSLLGHPPRAPQGPSAGVLLRGWPGGRGAGEGRGLPRVGRASELRRRRPRSSTFPGAKGPETLCARATSAEVQGHSDPDTQVQCTSSGPIFPPVSCNVSRIYPRRPSLPISGAFSLKNKLRNGGMLSQSSVCGSLTGPAVIPSPCQGFDPNEYGNQFWSKKPCG